MPVLQLWYFLNTARPLKQGSTNILTVIFSISFLQWEAITSYDQLDGAQGSGCLGTEKNTQLWWARLSCPPITISNIPMGSLFPPRPPKVTLTGSSGSCSNMPLQLAAIQMGAKPKPHRWGAKGEDTRCLAFEIHQKGWTQASPGSGLPSGNSGLSAAAVVRVVQQIHLLNDNSFIGKPIQLKPLHPTKSPAALSA